MLRRYREFLCVAGITAVMFFCAYFPVYRNYQRAPTDRYYLGAEEFPIDQLGNLAYVRQGYLGDTQATFNYSIFLGKHPSIIKFEYITIGHIGRMLHIDPIVMFRLAQFVLSAGYIVLVYVLIRSVIPSFAGRLTAFILVLFGSGIVLPHEPFSFPQGAIFDVLVFQRMTLAQPHYLLGSMFSMLSLYFLMRAFVKPQSYLSFALASGFGILVSFFYAPDIVLIVSGLPLFLLISAVSNWVQRKTIGISRAQIGIFLFYIALVLLPVVYVRYIVGYYWQDLNTAKMEFMNPFVVTFWEYVAAIGVTYVLAILSFPAVVKKNSPLLLLLWTWTIMHPVGEFVLSKFMHINPIRYFITPYYVSFGILSGVFIVSTVEWLHTRVAKLKRSHLYAGILCVILATSVISYQRTFIRASLCFCQPTILDFGYPTTNTVRSIEWLRDNTKPEDVVISGYHAGMLIPAFAGNTVYTSWWYRLIIPESFAKVMSAYSEFYRQNVDPESAHNFLTQYHIAYVYYSREESELNPSVWGLSYPFLTEVYNKGEVIIYSVNKK